MRQVTACCPEASAFPSCWKCGAVDQAAVDRGQEFCFEAGRGEAADHHAAALLGAVEVDTKIFTRLLSLVRSRPGLPEGPLRQRRRLDACRRLAVGLERKCVSGQTPSPAPVLHESALADIRAEERRPITAVMKACSCKAPGASISATFTSLDSR